MNTITLQHFLHLIKKDKPEGKPTRFHHFLLDRLNFYGMHNHHLWYDFTQPGTNTPRKRDKPVSLTEELTGDYLVYESCGHDGRYLIKSYDTLEEVEADLLGIAGIINTFTSEMFVVENKEKKRVKPYRIVGIDKNGEEVKFQKYINDDLFSSYFESSPLSHIQVVWEPEEKEEEIKHANM